MTILLSRIVPAGQLVAVHATLVEVEWEGVVPHISAASEPGLRQRSNASHGAAPSSPGVHGAGDRMRARAPGGSPSRAASPLSRSMPMTLPETISADDTLGLSELALLVKARQPTLAWGPPGAAKSLIARQVASDHGYNYVDICALVLDPVDLRGVPWRDQDGRTRWAPPVFLSATASTAMWLLNLEQLASCVPMVQAAL